MKQANKTTTGRRRRERLALPLVPSRQTWERERALGLLMFDTRPNGRGREDSAEEMSQRNWTTEQSLPAPPLSGRFQFCATRQPIQFPSWFSTPSRRIRKENIGPWETRHTSSLEVPGTQARASRPLHTRQPGLAAEWYCWGWGSGTAPARDSRSHKLPQLACGGTFAHGHALSAQAAPSDPLLSASSSLAALPNCSRPFNHSQLSRFAQSVSFPAAGAHGGKETRRLEGQGPRNSPQASWNRTPSFPRPSPPPRLQPSDTHPFYSPGHQRRGAHCLSGGMCLVIT